MLLASLSFGVGSASSLTTASPDKVALDGATRDFITPLRGCVRVVKTFVTNWNTEKLLGENSKMPYRIGLLPGLLTMRSACRAARTEMLGVSTAGFPQAGKDGRGAVAFFLAGMSSFAGGATHHTESFFVRARNQFSAGQAAYKRAVTGLNLKRAAAGLGPLPLQVRP